MQLDIKDKKILFELSSDSRDSFSSIAKKVGLSKEVVTYRVKNLVDNKIITRFFTELNSGKLNYQIIKLNLKFQNITDEIEQDIFNFFKEKPYATWVATCTGSWDMMCGVERRNIIEYNQVLIEFLNRFSQYILAKDIVLNIALHNYNKKWLMPTASGGVKTIVGGEQTETKLDKIDYIILAALTKNSREPLTVILEKCKKDKIEITTNALRYRIKELEKKGVINAYRVSLNLKELEREFCKAFLYLHQKTEEKEKSLIAFCKQHPDITAVIQCVGRWDFEIEFEVPNIHVFHNIMRDIRHKFDFVKSYDAVIITKEYGINYAAVPPEEFGITKP